ncbi:hypothetical protein [Neptuniibacter sp.]|uniref:hypothetical protein n=1 Tax=Neptuniibacter sp. TaxID=1962643 RepID=UPI00260C0652|nr:hypothetical protein [Neptuniibacter sp.]MCP4596146.1 hypothetical protein [Neptuniibacter sp.]
MIYDTVTIENLPEIVHRRSRFGNWEVDTVLGKKGTGALVTSAERKSRMYLYCKVAAKRAADVRDTMIDMLKPYADSVQ